MGRTFRFWLVYRIAWLPFVASYLRLLVAHLGRPLPEAIRATIIAVLPPTLLGVGVVAMCDRFRWRPRAHIGFFSIHLLLAAFYFLSLDRGCEKSCCAWSKNWVRLFEQVQHFRVFVRSQLHYEFFDLCHDRGSRIWDAKCGKAPSRAIACDRIGEQSSRTPTVAFIAEWWLDSVDHPFICEG